MISGLLEVTGYPNMFASISFKLSPIPSSNPQAYELIEIEQSVKKIEFDDLLDSNSILAAFWLEVERIANPYSGGLPGTES